MAEEQEGGSRFGDLLNSIDAASRKLEGKIKDRARKNSEGDSPDDAPEIEHVSREEDALPVGDSDSIGVRPREGIRKLGQKATSSIKGVNLPEKASKAAGVARGGAQSTWSFFSRVGSHLPYLAPATVILQTAIWLAYLSNGSLSNDLVEPFIDGMGKGGRAVTILVSVFGAIGAYLLSLNFDSGAAFDEVTLLPSVIDAMVVLLVISSVLYVMKSFHSLYYLAVVFIGSFVLRIGDAGGSSYDYVMIVLSTVGMIGFFSATSLVLLKDETRKRGSKRGEIDLSLLDEDDSGEAESSYLKSSVVELDSLMDQAPVTKPRRPRRRSEYEMYEWVLLLANLIMWPTVIILSIILGSGVEVNGNAYNMDDNYLMLLGPLALTLFFFTMLYKMDANARDGSLYAAEKQSYLDEMDKYVEARKAYLELVTLQAELKKKQIVESPSSEE